MGLEQSSLAPESSSPRVWKKWHLEYPLLTKVTSWEFSSHWCWKCYIDLHSHEQHSSSGWTKQSETWHGTGWHALDSTGGTRDQRTRSGRRYKVLQSLQFSKALIGTWNTHCSKQKGAACTFYFAALQFEIVAISCHKSAHLKSELVSWLRIRHVEHGCAICRLSVPLQGEQSVSKRHAGQQRC